LALNTQYVCLHPNTFLPAAYAHSDVHNIIRLLLSSLLLCNA